MDFGKIIGTVVATANATEIPGSVFHLVEICDHTGKPKRKHIIALDPIGAGIDEFVLFAQGSSARQTQMSDKKPIDAIIVGIIDLVEENDAIVYRK